MLAGPVCQQYVDTLIPLPAEQVDAARAEPSRRLVRLITEDAPDETLHAYDLLRRDGGHLADLVALFHDPAGRLVAELRPGTSGGPPRLAVEWPTSLPTGWTDTTVIAADQEQFEAGVFALTSTPDGGWRVDPVPNPGRQPGYTWGYDGTGPTTLYGALAACATGGWTASRDKNAWLTRLGHLGLEDRSASRLWDAIRATDGPLRLPGSSSCVGPPRIAPGSPASRRAALGEASPGRVMPSASPAPGNRTPVRGAPASRN
ncbi:hypothetical protein [Dactylosporangium sp. CA-092794]|uniref:hypothetical protein n=1 Tax=Dactylosporangium sp. CA-092794 TaxID=3239929 RepID=UPI003D92F4FE